MSHLDKTKSNIRLDKMEEADRKDLFNKFVGAGGKVIKDKKNKKNIIIDRNKQQQLASKLDQHYREKVIPQKKFSAQITDNAVGSKRIEAKGGFSRFIDRFIIKLKLRMTGVTGLSGGELRYNFLEHLTTEYKSAMIELQMIYMDIFKSNPIQGERITQQLDMMRPLFFELIEMTADLYDRTLMAQMTDPHTAFPYETKYTSDYRLPALALFKKLFPLQQFENTIYTAFEKAIEIQMRVQNGQKSQYSAKKKKANNGIYVLFHKLFPRLYWLFCYYHGEIVAPTDYMRIEQILMIGPDQRPGMRTAAAPVSRFSEDFGSKKAEEKAREQEDKDKAMEELKKKNKVELSDEVKRGLEQMKNYNFAEMRRLYLGNLDMVKNIPDYDTALRAYLLFLEFDKEYSIILTTNKIKYNVIIDRNGRRDYRNSSTELFNSMRTIEDSFRQYFVSFDKHLSTANEKNVSKEKYISHTKALMEYEREKKQKGVSAKGSFTMFLTDLSDHISLLLNDYVGLKKILMNPTDVIETDPGVETMQKLSGLTVIDALTKVYDYAQAVIYRLSREGDLFTEPEVSKTADAQPSAAPVSGNETPINAPRTGSGEEKKEQDSSILNELQNLDDLL